MHCDPQHTDKPATVQMKSVLTITTVPASLTMGCKAEHRNSNEDGQNDISGNDPYYRPRVHYITGTTFCEREK